MLILKTIIVLTVIIGVLVFVHELGHFLAAKFIKVKVEEFAFGFGKMLFGKQIGETMYRINLLPLGGYVKLLGEEEKSKDPRSFSNKSIGQRALVLFAGVFMNFIFGICIFYLFLALSGFSVALVKLADYKFIGLNPSVNANQAVIVIEGVVEDSPAAKAGIEELTILKSIDGEEIDSPEDLTSTLDRKQGMTVPVVYINSKNEDISKDVTLNKREGDNTILGIEYSPYALYKLDYSGNNKYFSGVSHAVNMLGYQLVVLGDLIKQSFETRTVTPVANNVTGVVGLAEQTYQITKLGDIKDILNLAGIVSIMLAFMNILPIPVLDGGHMAFLILEQIRGRKLAEKYEEWANRIGFYFLILLTILITVKDFIQFDIITRLFDKITSIF